MPVMDAVLKDYGGNIDPMPIAAQINASQLSMRAKELADAKAERLAKEKAAAKAHQDALQQHIGDMFDDKNYVTGTDMDKLISQQLAQAKVGMAKYIDASPNQGLGNYYQQAEQMLGGVKSLYQNGLEAKRNLTEYVNGQQKIDPDFNAGLAYQLGMQKLMYEKDPNGKWQFRPDLIAEKSKTNPIEQLANENPKLFTNGSGMDFLNSKLPTHNVKGTMEVDNGKTKRVAGFDDIINDSQELVINPKTKQPTGEVRVINNPVDWGSYKNFPQVNDATYDHFTSTFTKRRKLESDTDDWLAKHNMQVEKGTPDYLVAERGVLYDGLSALPAKKLSEVTKQDTRPITNVKTYVNNNKQDDYTWIPGHLQGLKDNVFTDGHVDVDPITREALGKDTDKLFYDKNTDRWQKISFEYGIDGKPIKDASSPYGFKVDGDRSPHMTDQQMTAALSTVKVGLSGKQAVKEMKQTQKNQKSGSGNNIAFPKGSTIWVNGKQGTANRDITVDEAKKNNVTATKQ